jgi:hypothetical protein
MTNKTKFTFHGRTALRITNVFAAAALLLTMAFSAHAQLLSISSKFTIDFTGLICDLTTKEVSSDEPYVFLVVGNLVTGQLVVSRTGVFGDVDTGESRAQTVRIWGPTGVASAFPNGNPENLVILVAPMEHDDCDVQSLHAKLQSSLQSRFLTLRAQLGGITRASLVTQLATTMAIQQQCSVGCLFCDRDQPIGRPEELHITSRDVSNTGTVEITLNHDGRDIGNGFYRTVFRVQGSTLTLQRR